MGAVAIGSICGKDANHRPHASAPARAWLVHRRIANTHVRVAIIARSLRRRRRRRRIARGVYTRIRQRDEQLRHHCVERQMLRGHASNGHAPRRDAAPSVAVVRGGARRCCHRRICWPTHGCLVWIRMADRGRRPWCSPSWPDGRRAEATDRRLVRRGVRTATKFATDEWRHHNKGHLPLLRGARCDDKKTRSSSSPRTAARPARVRKTVKHAHCHALVLHNPMLAAVAGVSPRWRSRRATARRSCRC